MKFGAGVFSPPSFLIHISLHLHAVLQCFSSRIYSPAWILFSLCGLFLLVLWLQGFLMCIYRVFIGAESCFLSAYQQPLCTPPTNLPDTALGFRTPQAWAAVNHSSADLDAVLPHLLLLTKMFPNPLNFYFFPPPTFYSLPSLLFVGCENSPCPFSSSLQKQQRSSSPPPLSSRVYYFSYEVWAVIRTDLSVINQDVLRRFPNSHECTFLHKLLQ